MKPKSIINALSIFQANHGCLTTTRALGLGIQARTLYQMRDAGLLTQESRGLFRLAALPPWSYPDLTVVALRIPRGVICLVSALHFHGLTTQIPHQVDLALMKQTEKPRLSYPPLRFVWMGVESFRSGVEQHELDGVPVNMYSVAKTIADCFKFRNKVGMDLALEALREGLNGRRCSVDEILHYARINRVARIIRPYIEALV